GTVCVVGKIRDLILQLSKSSIYSTKPPFVWKNEIGPSSYAQTRGCHNLAFFYKDELSVVDIQGLQHV
ncbi:hypothetical protein OU636_11815, partial [Escherichia coli]|nr:hypothetical protein [Escherichia coli]